MHNSRNPAVKRLMREAMDLATPTELYYAQPLEDNLFEWHFTIRGPVDSDFDGGVYHGRVLIPGDYPMKPPNIILLTPNGRFEVNKKICLSISGYHPETWRPAWSIRTALLALIGFMPTHGMGAIGSLEYPPEERRKLARQSRDWRCQACGAGVDLDALLLGPVSAASAKETQEARDLAKEIALTGEKPTQQADAAGAAAGGQQPASSASSPELAALDSRRPPQQAQQLQPPLSFHDWLVRAKGYSEARATELMEQQQQQHHHHQLPTSATTNRAAASPRRSILRDEMGTIIALAVLGLAIAFLLARRALMTSAGGGYDSADPGNSW